MYFLELATLRFALDCINLFFTELLRPTFKYAPLFTLYKAFFHKYAFQFDISHE